LLFQKHQDAIKRIYEVEDIQIRTLYIIVSSLGVVPKETVSDFKKMLKEQVRKQEHY
jgi:hypothetical protein